MLQYTSYKVDIFMGRAPCCEKVGLKRGRWTAEEDEILAKYIQIHGEGSWRSLPKNAGLLRCGKSCRLRWINYLRTDLKRGNITAEEEETIVKLHNALGNKWSLIAGHLPGRTDNEIKNYWNSHLRRKIYSFRKSYNKPLSSVVNIAETYSESKWRHRRNRTSQSSMTKNKRTFSTVRSMSMGKQESGNINIAEVKKKGEAGPNFDFDTHCLDNGEKPFGDSEEFCSDQPRSTSGAILCTSMDSEIEDLGLFEWLDNEFMGLNDAIESYPSGDLGLKEQSDNGDNDINEGRGKGAEGIEQMASDEERKSGGSGLNAERGEWSDCFSLMNSAIDSEWVNWDWEGGFECQSPWDWEETASWLWGSSNDEEENECH